MGAKCGLRQRKRVKTTFGLRMREFSHLENIRACDASFPGGPVDHRQSAETCESHIMRPIRE